ncbi:hypothetical protein IVA98_26030 [Bradyrhizobium sp. 160]|uniref:hypothetical protein n=1 Tax=Bradyrhizobium sp. 160 TaxID=2782634 RepID=UPI001FFBC41D|nr:hypothetical protein [Bradyrhizobium sp. 160]MCK1626556.1 hypothetical protein [Bradyrhizobium sp. 160]
MTPIKLPLITSCPSASELGAFADSSNPTIQVQMDSLGGQVHLVELSFSAAKSLMTILANWKPLQDHLLERQTDEWPRRAN